MERFIQQLKNEYKEVQNKFKSILKISYGFIAHFLSQVGDESFVSSVNRFTETRTASSKINTVLTTLMLKYTNTLIHHLLKAGYYILTNRGGNERYSNVNLVTFRVSDIMRSKYQTS